MEYAQSGTLSRGDRPAVFRYVHSMYSNDTYDPLHKALSIRLTVATASIRSNWAGTGQTRKRSLTLTMVLATEITEGIFKNYWFYENDRRIGKLELIDTLTQLLWAIPDDLAKRAGNKLQEIHGPARDEVALRLEDSLLNLWRMEFISLDPRSPYYRIEKGNHNEQ